MIALDTNLLIYAHRSALPEHLRARRAIERASQDPTGWGLALPAVAEFWSVVTHPAGGSRRSPGRKARDFLTALVEAGAQIYLPGEGFRGRLTQLATDLGVEGPRIFDLQIALTAFDNGATEIWTHDANFMALPGLRVHDPL